MCETIDFRNIIHKIINALIKIIQSRIQSTKRILQSARYIVRQQFYSTAAADLLERAIQQKAAVNLYKQTVQQEYNWNIDSDIYYTDILLSDSIRFVFFRETLEIDRYIQSNSQFVYKNVLLRQIYLSFLLQYYLSVSTINYLELKNLLNFQRSDSSTKIIQKQYTNIITNIYIEYSFGFDFDFDISSILQI